MPWQSKENENKVGGGGGGKTLILVKRSPMGFLKAVSTNDET